MQANKTFCQSLGYTFLFLLLLRRRLVGIEWHDILAALLIAHLVCNEFLIAIQLLAKLGSWRFPTPLPN